MADSTAKKFFGSLSKRDKIVITAVLYYSNCMLGVCLNFLGPCVSTFNYKMGVNTDVTSIVFVVISGAYVSGSFLYLLTERFTGRHLGAIVYLSMFALPIFVFPYMTNKWPFYVLGGFVGLGVGGYDPAQIVWIIDLWGHESGPFILAQHFSYSLGTVIPPLLLAPFVHDYTEVDKTTTPLPPDAKDQLYIPFTIGGILSSAAILAQVALYVHLWRLRKRMSEEASPPQKTEKVEMAEATSEEDQPIQEVHEDPRIGKWLVVLTCLFIGAFQGMEMDNLQFMSTFAENSDAGVSTSLATKIVSACTGAYATGRLIGIVAVLRVRPEYILVVNYAFLIAGTFCLFFMGTSKTLLWVGAILLGFGFSTNFPAYFAYIEEHMVVTDSRAAYVTMSGSFIAFVYPFIVGGAIEENIRVMNYVTFGSLVVMFFTFSTVYYLTAYKFKKNKNK